MVVVKGAELGDARSIFIAGGIIAKVSSIFAVVLVGPVSTAGS